MLGGPHKKYQYLTSCLLRCRVNHAPSERVSLTYQSKNIDFNTFTVSLAEFFELFSSFPAVNIQNRVTHQISNTCYARVVKILQSDRVKFNYYSHCIALSHRPWNDDVSFVYFIKTFEWDFFNKIILILVFKKYNYN